MTLAAYVVEECARPWRGRTAGPLVKSHRWSDFNTDDRSIPEGWARETGENGGMGSLVVLLLAERAR